MTNFKHAPIQRHDALIPFSRDHYLGLVHARHLIKAAQGDDADARRRVALAFLDAWRKEIRVHFEDEERHLLPLMQDDERKRLMDEHRRLTSLAVRVEQMIDREPPSPALLNELGTLLEAHIRWEERDLFNKLQQATPSTRLDNLQNETSAVEASRDRSARRPPPTSRIDRQPHHPNHHEEHTP